MGRTRRCPVLPFAAALELPIRKEQVNVMLQNLLIGRLGLGVHHESRVLPTYRLTVDAKGSKLKPSEEGSTVNLAAPGARAVPGNQGFVPVPRGQNIVAMVRDGHLRIHHQPRHHGPAHRIPAGFSRSSGDR